MIDAHQPVIIARPQSNVGEELREGVKQESDAAIVVPGCILVVRIQARATLHVIRPVLRRGAMPEGLGGVAMCHLAS